MGPSTGVLDDRPEEPLAAWLDISHGLQPSLNG